MFVQLFRILTLAALVAAPISAFCSTLAQASVVEHCSDKMDHDTKPIPTKQDCTNVACAATVPEFDTKLCHLPHDDQPTAGLARLGKGIVVGVDTPPPKVSAR